MDTMVTTALSWSLEFSGSPVGVQSAKTFGLHPLLDEVISRFLDQKWHKQDTNRHPYVIPKPQLQVQGPHKPLGIPVRILRWSFTRTSVSPLVLEARCHSAILTSKEFLITEQMDVQNGIVCSHLLSEKSTNFLQGKIHTSYVSYSVTTYFEAQHRKICRKMKHIRNIDK